MASLRLDLDLLRTAAHPLSNGKSALDPLVDLTGDASFVLLGEASHGTHEFYSTRAAITERLIKEKGFQAVLHSIKEIPELTSRPVPATQPIMSVLALRWPCRSVAPQR